MGDEVYMSMVPTFDLDDFEITQTQEPIPEFANMGPLEHVAERLAGMPLVGAIALAPIVVVAWTAGAIKDKIQEKRSSNG